MNPAVTPSPAPPAPPPLTPAAAPPPPPPPPAPRRGRSKLVRLAIALPIAIAIAVGVVLVVKAVFVQPNEDAKTALRDARADVARSIPRAQAAGRHTASLLRGDSVARNRRAALADLGRVVTLRKRAIARADDVPSRAGGSYRSLANELIGQVRNSLANARALRARLSRLRPSAMNTGVVIRAPGTGFIVSNATTGVIAAWTTFVGSEVTLLDFDRSVRRANDWIR